MYRRLFLGLCLALFPIAMVAANDINPDEPGSADAKMVRGMSVLGNNEAPMSLFIVPWKGSELGAETSLSRTLNEKDVPVDREVFLRELEFYQVSVGGKPSAAGSGR
jgi:hypothetical protein